MPKMKIHVVGFATSVDPDEAAHNELLHLGLHCLPSLSMPMGVDYVVIGFDMEVQPLVIHNAA